MKKQQEPLIEIMKLDNSVNSVDVDINSIFLFGEIDDQIAKEIWSKIHLLDDQRSKEPIRVYINSGGGDVDAMTSILGCLDNTVAEVHVYITGLAASAAATIALVGHKVFISKYATMMFHCYSVTINDQKQQDAANYAKSAKEIHDRVMKTLLKKRGINYAGFFKNYEKQDWYISPEQALKMKLVDGIY